MIVIFWDMDIKNQEADLKCINNYLLSFFEFAAGSNSAVFDQNEWLAFRPADGQWFYSRYKRNVSGGSQIKQVIDRLFAMDKLRRNIIYQAIAHDMKFAENLTQSFKFQTILLGEKEQQLIKDFYLYFFENVLSKSFFDISGLSTPHFGRKEFVKKYFGGANRNIRHICPVCMQTVTDGLREEQIEHYFSKTFVPCLALHPNNLYFICGNCNGSVYKGEKKFCDKGRKDVHKVFLPYVDTVRDKVNVNFEHEKEEDVLKFIPANEKEPYIKEKIEIFDYFFELPKRWSQSLERFHTTAYRKYRRRNPDNEDKLRNMIEDDAKEIRLNLDIRPEMYLEGRYLEWLGSAQLKAFYSNVKQEGLEAVVVGDNKTD